MAKILAGAFDGKTMVGSFDGKPMARSFDGKPIAGSMQLLQLMACWTDARMDVWIDTSRLGW